MFIAAFIVYYFYHRMYESQYKKKYESISPGNKKWNIVIGALNNKKYTNVIYDEVEIHVRIRNRDTVFYDKYNIVALTDYFRTRGINMSRGAFGIYNIILDW